MNILFVGLWEILELELCKILNLVIFNIVRIFDSGIIWFKKIVINFKISVIIICYIVEKF